MKDYRKEVARIVVSCLLILLMAEAGLRIFFFLTNRDIGAFDPGYFLYRPDIFTGYSLAPNSKINHITLKTKINSLGYRGREFTAKKPDGTYRIIILGGSESYGHGLNDGETWPDRLQILFDADKSNKVEVLNTSVDGFSSFQALTSFATRLLDFDPDLVLCYLGWNDIKYWPLISPSRGFADTGLAERKDSPSNIDRWLHYSYLYILGRALRNKIPREFVGISPPAPASQPPDTDSDLEYGRRVFERNIRSIVAIAKANHIRVCLINQLNLLSRPLQDQEKSRIYFIMKEDKLVKAVRQVRVSLERISEEEDVPFVDLNALITPDLTVLSDHVHATPKGSSEIARKLHDYLIGSGLLINAGKS